MNNEEQRSTKWFEDRLGRFTSSSSSVLISSRGNLTAGAETYIYEKAMEVLTGHRDEIEFLPKSITWGIDNEIVAKHFIESRFLGKKIQDVGFLPDVYNSGASPDGLTDSHVIEIKCPYTAVNHFKALDMDTGDDLLKYNNKYYHQVQCQLHAANKEKAFFFTYAAHDWIPEEMKLSILEIDFNPEYWANFEKMLILANNRLHEIIGRIKAKI